MTCGQRADHQTHHHQEDPVVMVKVMVKLTLTLKVGDVAYPWVFVQRQFRRFCPQQNKAALT